MGGLSEPLFYLHSGNTGLRAPRNVKISMLGSMLQMGVSSEVLCSLFDGGVCVPMGLTCSSSPLPQVAAPLTTVCQDHPRVFVFQLGALGTYISSHSSLASPTAGVSSGKSDSLVVRGLGP